jgi:hypothetical protein
MGVAELHNVEHITELVRLSMGGPDKRGADNETPTDKVSGICVYIFGVTTF